MDKLAVEGRIYDLDYMVGVEGDGLDIPMRKSME
jgi:hypothetical protein